MASVPSPDTFCSSALALRLAAPDVAHGRETDVCQHQYSSTANQWQDGSGKQAVRSGSWLTMNGEIGDGAAGHDEGVINGAGRLYVGLGSHRVKSDLLYLCQTTVHPGKLGQHPPGHSGGRAGRAGPAEDKINRPGLGAWSIRLNNRKILPRETGSVRFFFTYVLPR